MSKATSKKLIQELAPIYLTMAVSMEGDFSYVEREAVTDTMHARFSALDRAEVQNLVLESLAAHPGDSLRAAARKTAYQLNETLDLEDKEQVLEDLAEIARADGVVLDTERSFLNALSELWEVTLSPDAKAQPGGVSDGINVDWGWLHHLAFLYLVMAHGPDHEFSPDERQVILNKLHTWKPDIEEQAAGVILRQAMECYAAGTVEDMTEASIQAIKKELDKAQRKAALQDLIQIANIDGVFLDSEEDFLNELRMAWEVV